MPTVNRTRPLATELEFQAEKVRDRVITRFLQIVYPGVTEAFRLSGEAELCTDPEADPMWNARAERALSDLTHVEVVLAALVEHMMRDNVAVESLLDERRCAGELIDDPSEVTRLRAQVAELRDVLERLANGGVEDGATERCTLCGDILRPDQMAKHHAIRHDGGAL